jgi:ABC-2 type transport system permease protein
LAERAERPRPRIVLAAFVRRALLEETSYRAAQLFRAIGFFAGVTSLYYLARLVDASPNPHLATSGSYTGFLLLGVIGADLQRVGASALPGRVREAQLQGTLEAMLATPTPAWLVLAGIALPDLLAALGRALLYVALLHVVAPSLLTHANAPLAALVAVLALAAFAALGLAGAAFTLLLRRGDPTGMLVGGLSLIAGGVLYPVSVLPPWLQAAGRLVPVTSALEALRAAVLEGAAASAIAPSLARLALFALVVFPAAAALFAAALARARRDGSLASY